MNLNLEALETGVDVMAPHGDARVAFGRSLADLDTAKHGAGPPFPAPNWKLVSLPVAPAPPEQRVLAVEFRSAPDAAGARSAAARRSRRRSSTHARAARTT